MTGTPAPLSPAPVYRPDQMADHLQQLMRDETPLSPDCDLCRATVEYLAAQSPTRFS